MDDTGCIGRDCGVRFRCGKAAESNSGLVKAIRYTRKIVWIALFLVLPWNAYAATERFSGIQVQLEGLVEAPVNPGAPVHEPILDQAEMTVPGSPSLELNADRSEAHNAVLNQDLASLDVVDTGVLNSNPKPASLDVVDTGTTRQVQHPQPVTDVPTDAESPVAPESEENVSTPGKADELNTAATRVDDHQARNYKVMLPAIDVVDQNRMTGAVVETGLKNGQPEEASVGEAGEENMGLPYAVLLAILALMSMIPVARRNG